MIVQAKINPSTASLVISTLGLSLTTQIIGFGTTLYFVMYGAALAFAMYSALSEHGKSLILLISLLFILLIHSAITSIYYLDSMGSEFAQHYVRAFVVIAVILVASATRRVDDIVFSRVMTVVALAHVVTLGVSIVSNSASLFSARLAEENVAVAALAEIALGTAWAALLSRNKAVAVVGVCVAAAVIFLTQMRTAGVALVVSVLAIAALQLSTLRWTHARLVMLVCGFGGVILFLEARGRSVVETFRAMLLLDDRMRGINSGFSGRFDNFQDGWRIFLENPIIGVGFGDAVANYTHTAYILTPAQYGLPISIMLFSMLFAAIWTAARERNVIAFGVLVGLAFYYIGYPRSINSQLCPLIGIICVARTVGVRSDKSRAARERSTVNCNKTSKRPVASAVPMLKGVRQ